MDRYRLPAAFTALTAVTAIGCLLCAALGAGEEPVRGKWLPISDPIMAELEADHKKVGYPGGAAGIAVDDASGAVFVVVCDQGMWRSSDHGATFARVDRNAIGGRCETGFALDADPAGKRLMCFMIYGSSALTLDGGETWTGSALSHLDFGATDWSDAAARTLIAVKHESGGEAVLSKDAGRSWSSLGKGFVAVGIFPSGVLMACRGHGIERSADAGASWSTVAAFKPAGLAMRLDAKGNGYWTSDAGVQVSGDAGQSWKVLGAPVRAYYGPYFGDKPGRLVVVGDQGLSESDDGAASWKVVAPLPPDFKVGFTGPTFAWDAAAGIFYASSMGKPALRFVR
jgi:hypothetical protein